MNNHKTLRLFRPALHAPVRLLTALALALTLATAALAQVPNKDTAKDRQDSNWGTRDNQSQPYFEENANGSSWGVIPGEKQEADDPYEDIIITVDPDVSWPPTGSESTTSTTTHTSTDPAEANTTESTTTTTTW